MRASPARSPPLSAAPFRTVTSALNCGKLSLTRWDVDLTMASFTHAFPYYVAVTFPPTLLILEDFFHMQKK